MLFHPSRLVGLLDHEDELENTKGRPLIYVREGKLAEEQVREGRRRGSRLKQ